MAGERASFHADAFFQAIFAQVGAPRPGGDDHLHIVFFRRHAQLARAIKRHRAEVAGFQAVGLHHVQVGGVDFFFAERQAHAQDMGRAEQAVGVILQTENRRALRRFVGAHTLEHAHAVVQGVGQHMGVRLAPGHEFAVKPDETVAVSHRHEILRSLASVCKIIGDYSAIRADGAGGREKTSGSGGHVSPARQNGQLKNEKREAPPVTPSQAPLAGCVAADSMGSTASANGSEAALGPWFKLDTGFPAPASCPP